jgi:hypothetical protein
MRVGFGARVGAMTHRARSLQVEDWCASLPDADEERRRLRFRDDAAAIPAAIRRRTPRFELDALTCAVQLTTARSEIVFCSRYGNQAAGAALLQALARGELLSPTAFSHSVHNATPGLAVQAVGARASHTAVAAGQASLMAGVLEAWLRLATGEAESVVLVHADVPLPNFYDGLDPEPAPGLVLALRLVLAQETAAAALRIAPGRAGALELLAALQAGGDALAVPESFSAALAA